MLKRIVWSEPQVDADMHLKQYCRHLSSVDMVFHSFFGDCVLWLFHALFLWTWSCIHSLEVVFSDCSKPTNSTMEFYRVLRASGIQLDLLQKNRLVGASSECRYAFKALSFHRLTYCSLQTMLQTYARALLATLTNLKHNKRPTIYSAYPKLKQSKTSWIPTRFWSRDFTKTTGLKSKHSGHEKKLKTQTIVTSHSRIFCLADVSNILFKLGYASLPSSNG